MSTPEERAIANQTLQSNIVAYGYTELRPGAYKCSVLLDDSLIGTKMDGKPNLLASFKNLIVDGIKLKAMGEATHGVVSQDNRTPVISVMVSSKDKAERFCDMIQELAPNSARADIAALRNIQAVSAAGRA
ncbi:MAG: hypothetical protein J0M34_02960 [Alphaproteobacteria bacterium]|nr:hypothetical protein [Alphaproteobacteria bacterium]